MRIEKIFINVLNFIPDTIINKSKIELPISEEELDKYIVERVYKDASFFNEIDLNSGDTIIYKGKVFSVNMIETPYDRRKFIMLKLLDKKSENNENENI